MQDLGAGSGRTLPGLLGLLLLLSIDPLPHSPVISEKGRPHMGPALYREISPDIT